MIQDLQPRQFRVCLQAGQLALTQEQPSEVGQIHHGCHAEKVPRGSHPGGGWRPACRFGGGAFSPLFSQFIPYLAVLVADFTDGDWVVKGLAAGTAKGGGGAW